MTVTVVIKVSISLTSQCTLHTYPAFMAYSKRRIAPFLGQIGMGLLFRPENQKSLFLIQVGKRAV